MNEHHYQRIDKGLTRKERKEARQKALNQPISPEGRFLPIVPIERRAEIIQAVPERIRAGQTTNEIAKEFGIPGRTLRSWLISTPDADQARADFFSLELAARMEEIESSSEPMPLARAREAFRAWSWVAERRVPSYFGQKQEITHIQADLGERLRRAKERVIDQEVTVIPELPDKKE